MISENKLAMKTGDIAMVHRSTRHVWSLTLVASLPVLFLLITPGRSSGLDVRMGPMVKIAIGRREGLKELVTQRRAYIQKLLGMVQDRQTQLEPLLLSLNALGSLHATEAAKPLVDMLGRDVTPVGREIIIRVLPYHKFSKAVEEAIVAIGVPCRELILRELGELHGPPESSFLEGAVLGPGWKQVPETKYRRRLVQALQRIDGLPCAMFLVKAKLAVEKDKRRSENLSQALKLLEAAAEKKRPTTTPATSQPAASGCENGV